MSDEQPIVCPCCNNVKRDDGGFGCDCFGSGCSICHKCQGHCTGPQEHTPERICLLPQDQIKLVSVDGHDILGTLEMDDRKRIAFCRADGAIISLTDETDLDTIFAGIMRRRAEQDKQWGGPEHDDTHTPMDWFELIKKFNSLAMGAWIQHIDGKLPDASKYESRLFDILALATVAIESSRRKRAVQSR
jgi:hypothetical protein